MNKNAYRQLTHRRRQILWQLEMNLEQSETPEVLNRFVNLWDELAFVTQVLAKKPAEPGTGAGNAGSHFPRIGVSS